MLAQARPTMLAFRLVLIRIEKFYTFAEMEKQCINDVRVIIIYIDSAGVETTKKKKIRIIK